MRETNQHQKNLQLHYQEFDRWHNEIMAVIPAERYADQDEIYWRFQDFHFEVSVLVEEVLIAFPSNDVSICRNRTPFSNHIVPIPPDLKKKLQPLTPIEPVKPSRDVEVLASPEKKKKLDMTSESFLNVAELNVKNSSEDADRTKANPKIDGTNVILTKNQNQIAEDRAADAVVPSERLHQFPKQIDARCVKTIPVATGVPLVQSLVSVAGICPVYQPLPMPTGFHPKVKVLPIVTDNRSVKPFVIISDVFSDRKLFPMPASTLPVTKSCQIAATMYSSSESFSMDCPSLPEKEPSDDPANPVPKAPDPIPEEFVPIPKLKTSRTVGSDCSEHTAFFGRWIIRYPSCGIRGVPTTGSASFESTAFGAGATVDLLSIQRNQVWPFNLRLVIMLSVLNRGTMFRLTT